MNCEGSDDEDALAELRWQSELLILWMQPTAESESRRTKTANYLRSLVRNQPELAGARVLDTGSFASKTYLPDSDVDLTLSLPCESKSRPGFNSNDWILAVNNALCRAAIGMRPEKDISGRNRAPRNEGAHDTLSSRESFSSISPDSISSSAAEGVTHSLPIRNITFVCARVKLVSCVIGNLTVDVTCGKPSTSAAAFLLNEADRYLDQYFAACDYSRSGYYLRSRPLIREGGNFSARSAFLPTAPPRSLPSLPAHAQTHLFKRSLLLVKAWCLYESSALVRAVTGEETPPVLDSKRGRLSSSALSVMLLSLFNETAAERYDYLETLRAQELQPLRSPPQEATSCGQDENKEGSSSSSDSSVPAKVRTTSSSSSSGGTSQLHNASVNQKKITDHYNSAAQAEYAAQQHQQWQVQQQQWLARAALACGPELRDPLAVLLRFLRVFAAFDWDRYALTVDGPVPLQSRSSLPKPDFNGNSSGHNRSSSSHESLDSRDNSKENQENARGSKSGGKILRGNNSGKTDNCSSSNSGTHSPAEVRPLAGVLASVRSAIDAGSNSNGARIRRRGEMSSSSSGGNSSSRNRSNTRTNSRAHNPAVLADGFPIRPGMHIVDPLDSCNNLAAGVGRCGTQAVTLALELGRQQLEGSVASYLHYHRSRQSVNQRIRRSVSQSSNTSSAPNLKGRIPADVATETSMNANSMYGSRSSSGSSGSRRNGSGSTIIGNSSSETTHSRVTYNSKYTPGGSLNGANGDDDENKDADLSFLTWTFPTALTLYGPAPPLHRRPVLRVPTMSSHSGEQRSDTGVSTSRDVIGNSNTGSKGRDSLNRYNDPVSPGDLALQPLGNALYKHIAAIQPPILPPDLVGKVTGMLLENPGPAVEALMENSVELENTVKDALTVLADAKYTAESDMARKDRIFSENGEEGTAESSYLSIVTGSGQRSDLLDHPLQTHVTRSRAPCLAPYSASNAGHEAPGSPLAMHSSSTNNRVFGEHGYDLEGYYLAADTESLRTAVTWFMDERQADDATNAVEPLEVTTNYEAAASSTYSAVSPRESSSEGGSSESGDEEATGTGTDEEDGDDDDDDKKEIEYKEKNVKSSSLDRSQHENKNGQTRWAAHSNWLESVIPWKLLKGSKQQTCGPNNTAAVASVQRESSGGRRRRNSGNGRIGKGGRSNKAPSSLHSGSTSLSGDKERSRSFQCFRPLSLIGQLVLVSSIFVIFGVWVYYACCHTNSVASEEDVSSTLPQFKVSESVPAGPSVQKKKSVKNAKPRSTMAAKTTNEELPQVSSTCADGRATATCDRWNSNNDVQATSLIEEAVSTAPTFNDMIEPTDSQRLPVRTMEVTVLGSPGNNVPGASQRQSSAQAAVAPTTAPVDTGTPGLEVRFVPVGADAVLGDFTTAAAMHNSDDASAKQKKKKRNMKDLAAVSVAWEYQWHMNGELLADSSNQPFYTISAASAASEGHYSCYARPKHAASHPSPADAVNAAAVETVVPGAVSAIDSSIAQLAFDTAPYTLVSAVTLRVASAPQVDPGLQTHSLSVGQPLRLEATGARGAPPPSCVWLFQNLPLDYYTEPGGGGRFSTNHGTATLVGSHGAEGAVLVVEVVDVRHAGTYTCRCANVLGVAVWEEGFVTVAEEPPPT